MKRVLIFIILFCFFIAVVVGFIFYLSEEIKKPKNPQGQSIIFTIKKGQGFQEICFNLDKAGLIRSRVLFAVYAFFNGNYKRALAGKYSLSSAMSTKEILRKITKGETLKEKITIIEGWDLFDIADYFQQMKIASQNDFFALAGEPLKELENVQLENIAEFSQKFSLLEDKPKDLSLEGFLFPDTYEIQGDVDLRVIIEKILENFSQKISQELQAEIAKQNKTIFEVITMASMLEKELITYEDKQIAAGILWKRLETGWPLQVDAALDYIIGKKSQDLTKDDLALASPYNTYRFTGLPLGPICNPGLESILASVYYKDSDYWFYLSKPGGETVFSKTLLEHNINKEKYLR